MNGLYAHGSSSRNQLLEWEKHALDSFFAKMSDKEKPFPCIPATIGFSMNQLKYGFIGSPRRDSTIKELASLLTGYTEQSREFGNYTSLIIFYETPDSMKNASVEEYEQIFWEQLSGLTALDAFEWPNDIPQDPHDPIWEFCFNGEQYFMYCATPAHKNRKSRHFDVMMLAITPRWVLQEFNKSQSYAQRIKAQVRKRLANYDSIAIHPDLNTYGSEDNFEWRQYFLRDDDGSLSKCPYHRVLKFLGIDK
ncbi:MULTISPECIES: YqcI/YcgG family protein [Mesobacillus]|uniref:YqcI/YcgG family protein n=1 Tax=Mesobacillus selenatarsenatis TaxID=388741 RepID=A0A846TDP1_9BACI|nr:MULTISPECIES: YqcI/YcgG family protein [Mesobacillus]NKE06653.1 YqcI/YcgG family protein [Mesobacillus selenatarsenatis]